MRLRLLNAPTGYQLILEVDTLKQNSAMTILTTPVSFIATVNSVNSRHFYESILGFKCLSDDSFALVFELGDTTLRIQKVESIPEINYTVLGWQVDNIRQCVIELSGKGVRFEKFSKLPQDDLGVWSAPGGASVAWFKDPDGNSLSLTEL